MCRFITWVDYLCKKKKIVISTVIMIVSNLFWNPNFPTMILTSLLPFENWEAKRSSQNHIQKLFFLPAITTVELSQRFRVYLDRSSQLSPSRCRASLDLLSISLNDHFFELSSRYEFNSRHIGADLMHNRTIRLDMSMDLVGISLFFLSRL